MTKVRLAHAPGTQGDNELIGPRQGAGKRGVGAFEFDRPALLISYAYLDGWKKNEHRTYYRDWAMDSGAFTAHSSGKPIRLEDYIRECRTQLDSDETLTEVFGLDVIGDWRASVRNVEKMWRVGIEAIPTYHHGSPTSVLKSLAKDYPKVALGNMVGLASKERKAFIAECFARVWPCKLHAFGTTSRDIVMSFPFHSVDASTWTVGPVAFGNWRSFGRLAWYGSDQNLRAEIEWHLRLERDARSRWRKDMELLESKQ